MLADVICYWKMTSFMASDGVTPILRKDVTNTHKRMRRIRSQRIGGRSSVLWRKIWEKLKTSNVFSSFIVC